MSHLKVAKLFNFPLQIEVSKILVTSGRNTDGLQTTSEIVDLTVKGGNKCNNWPDIPIGVKEGYFQKVMAKFSNSYEPKVALELFSCPCH